MFTSPTFQRGFPTAHCLQCEATQLVWRDAETGEPRCLACDASLGDAPLSTAGADDIIDRQHYVFYDVTASAEACACDDCPAQGKCDHTRPEDHA